jgi:hypothetical protein
MKLIKKMCMLAVTTFAVNKANAAAMCASTSGLTEIRAQSGSFPSNIANGWGSLWAILYNGNVIEGIAMCISGSPDSNQSWGGRCYCRMTKPVLGNSWVFYDASANDTCYAQCAVNCANCVKNNTSGGSCTRAVLLN